MIVLGVSRGPVARQGEENQVPGDNERHQIERELEVQLEEVVAKVARQGGLGKRRQFEQGLLRKGNVRLVPDSGQKVHQKLGPRVHLHPNRKVLPELTGILEVQEKSESPGYLEVQLEFPEVLDDQGIPDRPEMYAETREVLQCFVVLEVLVIPMATGRFEVPHRRVSGDVVLLTAVMRNGGIMVAGVARFHPVDIALVIRLISNESKGWSILARPQIHRCIK